MNREIKFRAWDSFKKQMLFREGFYLFGEVLTFSLLDQWCYENPNPEYKSSLLRCKDIIIQQFTGLHDKNGKEIYEGDIVKAVYYNHSSPNTIKIQYIDFENGCFSVKSKETSSDLENDRTNSPIFWLFAPSSIEVIGNIYESPELLKTN